MNKRLAAVVAALAIALGIVLGVTGLAEASNYGQICEGSPKIEVVGEHPTLTLSAPDGFLITGYCVKAGSAKQDLGPEYTFLDEPAATVTISHSSGKDISHYVLYLEEVPSPPTTVPTTTIPTTTVPPTTQPPVTVPPTTLPPVTTVQPTTTVTPSSPGTSVTIPSVQVSSTVLERHPESLPVTGRDWGWLAGLGFLLAVIGGALLLTGRRVKS